MATKSPTPPTTAEELLARYAAGERVFRGAMLGVADLRGANLPGAILNGAILNGAFLSGARLGGANLGSVQLSGADLLDARLANADLSQANLSRVDLRAADLTGANLRGALLFGGVFSGASFRTADMRAAHLGYANLDGAELSGANLGGATLYATHLTDIDLTPFCDADPPVEHGGPSIVDFRTIARSLRAPNLKAFLQRTGMPEIFVEYMIDCARTLDRLGVFTMLQSTFISYGSPDEPCRFGKAA